MNQINLNNQKYHFLITGGTGFIGKKLCQELLKTSQNITVLTRQIKASTNNKIKFIQNLDEQNFDYDVVINLCGAPISVRWTNSQKQKIFASRVELTKKLSAKILAAKNPPKVFLSGSAVGFYGTSDSQIFDEESAPLNQNLFSQKICQNWEDAAKISAAKTRLVLLRTGIVVEKSGGFLKKMLPIFKLGFGGKIGSGDQYLSWIHLSDVIGAIIHIINNPNISGAINLTAPKPATNQEFSKAFAKSLNRPCFFDVPAISLELIYGKMAKELLLEGQKVVPKKLLQNGYEFIFKNLNEVFKSGK
jgi:uncharacterized protein (TIGR01777 family)